VRGHGTALGFAPNQMAGMMHERDHLDEEAATFFEAVVTDTKPGEIPSEMFKDAKRLVVHCCRESKPWLATQLLGRNGGRSAFVNTGGYLLNREIFNMTISAWAKHHRPEMAEQVFSLMRNAHVKDPNLMPAPDHYSYNTLMVAWSAHESSTAIDRVLELFHEMEESEDVKPDAYTFNTVMASLANNSSEYGAAKAVEHPTQIFRTIFERSVRRRTQYSQFQYRHEGLEQ
jgi:pentatricopeptide repeat protein